MAISTYAELQTAVGNWLDRTDLGDRIPEFIAMAEAEFNRRLRTLDMLTEDTAFSIASQREDLPADYLGAKRFYLDRSPVVELTNISPDRLSDYRQRFGSSGIPVYYSVIGSSFEFLPTPSGTYTGVLLYYARIPALTNSNTTNWLLTSHPDLYMYGALKAAEPYVHNDQRLPVWLAQHEAAIRQLETQDARAGRGVPVMRGRSF
jgi:hypothetical protein